MNPRFPHPLSPPMWVVIKCLPSRAGRGVKCPGYALGDVEASIFDWYITNSFNLEQLTTKIREQNSNRHKRYWVLSTKQFENFEWRPISVRYILAACTRVCRTRWCNLWDSLNTRSAARLRSPSLIMAPESTRRFYFTDRRGKSSHAHLTTSGHKNDLLRTFEECKQLWWSVVLRLFFQANET